MPVTRFNDGRVDGGSDRRERVSHVGKAIKFERCSGRAASRQSNRTADGRPAVWLTKQIIAAIIAHLTPSHRYLHIATAMPNDYAN